MSINQVIALLVGLRQGDEEMQGYLMFPHCHIDTSKGCRPASGKGINESQNEGSGGAESQRVISLAI
jgi:hypothetical protein